MIRPNRGVKNKRQIDSSDSNKMGWMKKAELRPVGIVHYRPIQ